MEINQATKENITVMAKWMKFNGVIWIIYGIIYCLTCIGVIIGWAPILLGVWAINASKGFMNYIQNNTEAGIDEGFSKLKSIFLLTGILTIIFLALFVIYIIVMIIVFAVAGTSIFREILKNANI